MAQVPGRQSPSSSRPSVNITVSKGGVSMEMGKKGTRISNAGVTGRKDQRQAVIVGSRLPGEDISIPQIQNVSMSVGAGEAEFNSSVVDSFNSSPGQYGPLYGSGQTTRVVHVSNKGGGSNYSSPRSSIGSYDSKGSSPRTSIVGTGPPPLPYDHHRYGNPHAGVISSRPGGSGMLQEVKYSTVPASSTGVPSQRIGERFVTVSPRHTVTVEHHTKTPQDSMFIVSPRTGVTTLYDRFNEHAPPPPYDARMRAQAAVLLNSPQGPQSGQTSGHVLPIQISKSQPGPQIPNLPNKTAFTTTESSAVTMNVAPGVQNANLLQNQNVSPKSTSSVGSTDFVVPQPMPKLKGLHYDVVPPKQDGPSEAEKKLAALTQQLEKEMRVSGSLPVNKKGSTSSISSATDQPAKVREPPPYHGPHVTTSAQVGSYVMGSYTSAKTTNNVGSEQNSSPAPSNLSTPSSSRSNLSTGNLRTPLTVQVTQSPQSPSEAEKKVEALTEELENHMEVNPQGEYYGKLKQLLLLFFP